MTTPVHWLLRTVGAVSSRLGRRGKILLAISFSASVVLLAIRGPTAMAEARARASLYLVEWPNPDVQRAAFEELASHPSEPAVPGLVDLLDDEKRLAWPASRCLVSFGELAALPLAQAAREGDSVTRFWAVRTLGQIGPAAAAALPTVVGAFADPAPGVRHNALYAIETIDPGAATLELTSLLEGPVRDTTDSIIALRVLEVVGGRSPRARGVLERLAASDVDPLVRDVAVDVLDGWRLEGS